MSIAAAVAASKWRRRVQAAQERNDNDDRLVKMASMKPGEALLTAEAADAFAKGSGTKLAAPLAVVVKEEMPTEAKEAAWSGEADDKGSSTYSGAGATNSGGASRLSAEVADTTLDKNRSGSADDEKSNPKPALSRHAQRKLWLDRFLEANSDSPWPRTAGAVANSILFLIFVSTLLNLVETDPSIYAGRYFSFRLFEGFCVAIFTIEFLLRLYCTPKSKCKFICEPMHIIDILAFLPWYFEWLLVRVVTSESGKETVNTIVLILRVPRSLRLLRVARYSPTLQVFARAVAQSMDALLILIFLICMAIILYATMMHFAERGDVFIAARLGDGDRGWWSYSKDGTVEQRPFWSVPRAMWWCMATLTTVGYGDEYPETNSGKIIAAFAMLTGILIIALPVSVLGTNFSEAYEEMAKERREQKLKKRAEDQAATDPQGNTTAASTAGGPGSTNEEEKEQQQQQQQQDHESHQKRPSHATVSADGYERAARLLSSVANGEEGAHVCRVAWKLRHGFSGDMPETIGQGKQDPSTVLTLKGAAAAQRQHDQHEESKSDAAAAAAAAGEIPESPIPLLPEEAMETGNVPDAKEAAAEKKPTALSRHARQKLWLDKFLEAGKDSPWPRTASAVANGILLLIFVSTMFNVIETDPTIYKGNYFFFRVFEGICVVIFTIEFALRLYCTPRPKCKFICEAMHIIDILAFLPWYFEWVLVRVVTSEGGKETVNTIVLILRVPRTLRLLRVARYSPTLQVFVRAVVQSFDALVILIFLICLALILFSTMVHFAERGDVFLPDRLGDGDRGWWSYGKDGTVEQRPFWSVPRTMWWCMTTLTTVGYGDEVPSTNSGKIISAFAMLAGILIVALPVSVLGTNFAEAYEQ